MPERPRARRRRAGAILMLCAAGALVPPVARAAATCGDAAATVERATALPPGLLAAIAAVETGGRPWAVDADGAGRFATSASDAETLARRAIEGGARFVDVGCFQVDLHWHGDAFPSLAAAFDPATNATVAARFLGALRATAASWFDAVARYHTALPEQGAAYARRVFAAWRGGPAAPIETSGGPVPVSFGMQVWSPGAAHPRPARAGAGVLPAVWSP